MGDWTKQALLEHDDDEGTEGILLRSYRTVSPWWRTACLSILLFNVVIAVWWILTPQELAPNTLYAPANGAITYSKQRIWRPLKGNTFTGEPRPQLDDAWRELIKPMAIKISEHEAQKLGTETIAFKDGSGYMAEMAVFHELHCIKRLKQHLSLDYYHPNMTTEEAEAEVVHIDHCFEYLRQAAMCRGDTSLATFFWKDGRPKTRNWSDHICVDWGKLYDFALEQSVLVENYEGIVGPESN